MLGSLGRHGSPSTLTSRRSSWGTLTGHIVSQRRRPSWLTTAKIRTTLVGFGSVRFMLVHGGVHGAWYWGRTIAELERFEHEAVVVDLPGHGERASAHMSPRRRDAETPCSDKL